MKINQKRISNIFRTSEIKTPTFGFKGEDLVFPFEVKTGFVNATEEGFVYNNTVENYGRFERIFTGFEAITAIWKNSTKTYVETGKISGKKTLNKLYKPGDAFLLHFDDETLSDDFSEYGEDNNYTKESVVVETTFFSKNKLTEKDILNLYVIPKRYGKTLFFIKEVEEFVDPATKEFKYGRVKFKSLNDKLSKTGLAIDQYVQFSAPGEGFAWPKEIDRLDVYDLKHAELDKIVYGNVESIPSNLRVKDAEFVILDYKDSGTTKIRFTDSTRHEIISNINGYILDESKLETRPITSMQLEIYGPGVLSSVYAYGRPIVKNTNSNHSPIEIPRLLLPLKMNGPNIEQKDITKPLSMNTSWYWIPRSRMEIESFYKDWTEKIQGNWNPGITKKWLGFLRIIAGDYVSPQPSLGWRIFSDILSLGFKEIIYNMPDVEVGSSGYWEIKGVQTLPKLLAQGFFAHRNAPRLPLNYIESIPWTLKNIPLVGGMLTKLTLGLPVGWKDQKDTGGRNYNVNGLISSGFLEFYKNTFIGTKTETLETSMLGSKTQKYTAIPLDALKDDNQPAAISPGEFATIINFDLTDSFYQNTTDGNSYGNTESTKPNQPTSDIKPDLNSKQNTIDLGFEGSAKYAQDSMPAPRTNNVSGYAIDSFGFHFLGQADYKVSFFDKDGNVVFNGVYKTLSKLTNSIRDWNNNVKTSHWESEEILDTRTPLAPTKISLPGDVNGILNYMKNGVLEGIPLTKPNPEDPNAPQIPVRDSFGNIMYEVNSDGTIKYRVKEVIAPLGSNQISESNREIYFPAITTKRFSPNFQNVLNEGQTNNHTTDVSLHTWISADQTQHYFSLNLKHFSIELEINFHSPEGTSYTVNGWTADYSDTVDKSRTITIDGTIDHAGNFIIGSLNKYVVDYYARDIGSAHGSATTYLNTRGHVEITTNGITIIDEADVTYGGSGRHNIGMEPRNVTTSLTINNIIFKK